MGVGPGGGSDCKAEALVGGVSGHPLLSVLLSLSEHGFPRVRRFEALGSVLSSGFALGDEFLRVLLLNKTDLCKIQRAS